MKLKYLLPFFLFFLLFPYVFSQEVGLSYGKLSFKEDHLLGQVFVRDLPVFFIHQEDQNDPEIRAQKVADRINKIFSQGLSPDKISFKVEYNDKTGEEKKITGASIYWGDERLFTITPLQAKLNQSSPEKLAKEWSENLKKALSASPTLKIFPSELVLSPGESAFVKVVGSSRGELLWTMASSSDVISFNETDIPDRFLVKANNTGSAAVEFQRETKAVLNVYVRERAGEIKKLEEIILSGSPVGVDFIKEVVMREIGNAVLPKPGARLFVEPFNINTSPLYPGKETKVYVPFKVEGAEYRTLESSFTLKVRDEPAGFEKPVALLISNSPEKITSPGVLFSEDFPQGSAVRLMYYHVNKTESDKWIIIDLTNPYSMPVKVWLLSGYGGPGQYEAFVGQVATGRFLKNWTNSVGQFYTIPPGGKVSLYTQRIAPEQIVNGLCHIQFPSSSSLKITVRAEKSPYGEVSQNLLPEDSTNTQCRGVFFDPEISIEETYHSGEAEKSIYIGKKPFLTSYNTGVELYGNYGILYNVDLHLINDGADLKEIDLFFTSQGGIAQGTFLIDGKILETPVVRSSEHVNIATFLLKPGENRSVNIKTIPQGGSHYPVRILIKS